MNYVKKTAILCADISMFQYYYVQVDAEQVTFVFTVSRVTEKGIAQVPFFTKTLNVLSDRTTVSYDSNYDPLVINALIAHYNDAYCKREGLTTLKDYLSEGVHGLLESDAVYGQTIFYSDIDELYISDKHTIIPGQDYYVEDRERISVKE